jgi:hypothetical protein
VLVFDELNKSNCSIFEFTSFSVGKIQALLLAKRSPVRWGKQMCLNVRLAFYFCRSFCSLSLTFYTER